MKWIALLLLILVPSVALAQQTTTPRAATPPPLSAADQTAFTKMMNATAICASVDGDPIAQNFVDLLASRLQLSPIYRFDGKACESSRYTIEVVSIAFKDASGDVYSSAIAIAFVETTNYFQKWQRQELGLHIVALGSKASASDTSLKVLAEFDKARQDEQHANGEN